MCHFHLSNYAEQVLKYCLIVLSVCECWLQNKSDYYTDYFNIHVMQFNYTSTLEKCIFKGVYFLTLYSTKNAHVVPNKCPVEETPIDFCYCLM